MLKRIRIRGYKSLHDVDLQLRPLVVLLGPNAAGKSNFLDALQLLSRMVSSRTLKEAFDPPYRGKPLESFALGPKGIPELITRESATFSIEADVELSHRTIDFVNRQIQEMRRSKISDTNGTVGEKALATVNERLRRYRVEVEILPGTGILRIADEYLAALTEKGQPTGKRKLFLERIGPPSICEWKVKRIRPISSATSTIRSCRSHSMRRTIRISPHSARKLLAGCSSISNRANIKGSVASSCSEKTTVMRKSLAH